MNIIVVGGGWTGRKIMAQLQDRSVNAVLVSHSEIAKCDISDAHWVVNCAGVTGYPNVDACEDKKGETLQGNALFPISLYEQCKGSGCRLAHFSSGCIYEGKIDSVDADPNFFGSIYSISKGISDAFLKDKAMVFRIRMPFTSKQEDKNYLTKIRKYAAGAKLFDSGENSLTDHDEAVRVACDLILEDAPDGPYNLVNSGTITMRGLVSLMGITPSWFTHEEFTSATRAGRSTCVIPSCGRMRSLNAALVSALDGGA